MIVSRLCVVALSSDLFRYLRLGALLVFLVLRVLCMFCDWFACLCALV